MEFVGTVKGITENGDLIISMKGKHAFLSEPLAPGDYDISINPHTDGRSLNQNALLWKIIGDINHKENGRRKTADEISIYKNILRMAGTGVVTVTASLSLIPQLEKLYRVVEIVDIAGEDVVCKCYTGTSHMNKAEMSAVIDTALQYAGEVGLDEEIYK